MKGVIWGIEVMPRKIAWPKAVPAKKVGKMKPPRKPACMQAHIGLRLHGNLGRFVHSTSPLSHFDSKKREMKTTSQRILQSKPCMVGI